ncbi:hypothetical protein PoB_001447800 [Plakobranchus ocellatus]|uniref:Uncharacterized protein n=1 Tax=Plakobranchus ocellatus TaxID=259542 RepID=A0AAV3Z022_9GAST|nr:hypothetical protein PoB_001447800 [Plakobranchus ocellatus]
MVYLPTQPVPYNPVIRSVPSADDLFRTDDSDLPTSAPLIEEEINIREQEQETLLSQPEEEDENLAIAAVTSKQCLEALSTVQSYLLQQVGRNNHLWELMDIKSFVEDAAISKWWQKTINDYFKKE